ncbi:hypothetical protein DFS34DRAFT_579636 [Phlyctochytrium arcticum]|nr:hypothetical protein DFS34DRAFT_579636 [Phlyctochytrium arcticum]
MTTLASYSAKENLTVTGSTLAPFMIVRTSGTPGNVKVQNHLIDTFKRLNWQVEQDRFNETTPQGVKPFNNIIVTKNPNAPRKLVLAAHFDSKFAADYDFIGATDSAVPCAILVDVAITLNRLLEQVEFPAVTLQLIFFDGEEAFGTWSDTDSLYGSRHLAAKWENTIVMDSTVQSSGFADRHLMLRDPGSARNVLSQIDAFVLLDLLGTPEVKMVNMYQDTAQHWNSLIEIQRRLATMNLLSQGVTARVSATTGDNGYFTAGPAYGHIEDDHKPFLERGVPIVHVIPSSFPTVWHTQQDNANAIDAGTVHDYALIFRVFVAQYLNLQIV